MKSNFFLAAAAIVCSLPFTAGAQMRSGMMQVASDFNPSRVSPPVVSSGAASANAIPSLPPNAQPGECYARTFLPPVFRTEAERRLKSAASERIEVIPEQFEWIEESVLVKGESERIVEVIPAEYRWVEEQVLVKPAGERLEQIPATYRTMQEQELVKPATTMWKQGSGLIERLDHATGEIMCLVEVPAEYRTVSRQVVDTPATTRRIPIAAEYTTVRRQELVREAEVRKTKVPAEYKAVKVRKLVKPAEERRIAIPAEYQEVPRQVLVSEGRMEWRQVLCETNASPETVRDLQRALAREGYDPGQQDGRLGWQTLQAVKRYQAREGLAEGGVTMETLRRLGVSPTRVR